MLSVLLQPLDVVEYHAEHFVPFIRPSLEVTVVFNFTSRGTGNMLHFSHCSLSVQFVVERYMKLFSLLP